jgi:kexin
LKAVLTRGRGERPNGTWTVIVKDTNFNEHNGTFIDWRLNLWGESLNAAIQGLLPLPDEHDDDHETASASVSTTSIDPGSPPTSLPGNPTDHIDRPTKPTPTGDIQSTVTATTTAEVPGTAVTQTGEPTHTYSDSFLPSFFPTFGVSKKTQIWIYGAAGLIILFCVGLGVYSIVQRRKRLRNTRDGYEFEMVGTDDDDEARRGLNGRSGGKRPRRGGDLYDAFAGESDEDLYSDDEQYHDTPDTSGGSNGSEEKAQER